MEEVFNKESEAIKKVVISGPESTGKTTLAKELSSYFQTVYVYEYARDYVEKLGRPYTYEDVLHIARKQVLLEEEMLRKANRILFFDTHLEITKIWFSECFHRYPDWIDKEISRAGIDLYLMCYPDLPWIPDPVRENPGEKRMELFQMYMAEAARHRFPVTVVSGFHEKRLQNAIEAVMNAFPGLGNRSR
jgi:NadR type nicotinamide-nucleotide adenylyltransferase